MLYATSAAFVGMSALVADGFGNRKTDSETGRADSETEERGFSNGLHGFGS